MLHGPGQVALLVLMLQINRTFSEYKHSATKVFKVLLGEKKI
jgi:hypothetical protein